MRLTFPAQGRLTVSGSAPYNNVGIINRGLIGYYHSSYSTNNPRTMWLNLDSGSVNVYNGGDNPSLKVVSHNIRCVAE